MFAYFSSLNSCAQALLAGMFTFLFTVLGSGIVFFFRSSHKNMMDGMLALSAGIMLAASHFSLLNPAIEISNQLHFVTWFVILVGFFSGALFLFFSDIFLDYYSKNNKKSISSLKRSLMLFFSITLHNIPEGLVVGVAFGAIPFGVSSASIISAITLTIGIAIQNFPEGSAISLPIRRDGLSCFHAFLFGALSGIVEPIAAVIGALLVLKVQVLLPFIMSFTASAMIFVVVKELVPESQGNPNKRFMTILLLLGFSFMMLLELLLG